jgi:type II secretory ATPase GspE/PulE/Tfp pilus assembly ATPase PilB-like protein
MVTLAFISGSPAALSLREVWSSSSLLFNPVKLTCLVIWVYLCLYFVQRVQFSRLVARGSKSRANIATLFLGPLIVLVLLILDVKKASSEDRRGVFEVIKDRLQDVWAGIGSAVSVSSKDKSAIKLFDSAGRNIKEIYGHGKAKREDSHVLALTEQIITDALEQRASDILIDPKDESTYTLRFRVDGVLRTVEQFDPDACHAVVNSIKAVSSMDIAEKRRPQDGAFIAQTADGTVSFRVASAGVLNGEKLSVRVLSQNADRFRLANIGVSEKQKTIIENAVKKPSGLVLMCGPTGSGKTTTLYAMLNEIDMLTRNVITVEDPIEYVLPNASQIEVNPKADITFAKSLRSILRQDPDVICVGEIRDEETAAIALRASQTGHLVLATVHSDTNASAVVRLLDLGISPLLLSSGLDIIICQRLLRRLCSDCKVRAELNQNKMHEFRRKGINCSNIHQAEGCEKCHETGYYERMAIFDILVFDNKLKAQIANNQLSMTQLRSQGDKRGRSNLKKQGLKKVVSGTTSLKELNRVVG